MTAAPTGGSRTVEFLGEPSAVTGVDTKPLGSLEGNWIFATRRVPNPSFHVDSASLPSSPSRNGWFAVATRSLWLIWYNS